MLLGAVGASAVSQLYQSLTSQKTTASTGTQTQKEVKGPGGPPPPPPDGGDDQSTPSSDTTGSASAKVVADLKALLLGVQAGATGTASTTSAATDATTATTGSTGTDATGSSSDLASDLATLMGDLKKAGGHHRHGPPPGPPPDGPPPSGDASGTGSSTTAASSGQDLLTALTKGLNAYAASLKAGGTGAGSVSA